MVENVAAILLLLSYGTRNAFSQQKKVIDQIIAVMRLFQHVFAVTCDHLQGELGIQDS